MTVVMPFPGVAAEDPGSAATPLPSRMAVALLALTAYSFAFSIYLSWVEAVFIHAWCLWCIASAVLATLLFVAALPELGRLRAREGHP